MGALLGMVSVLLLLGSGCSGRPDGARAATQIIDDLVSNRYGAASARYRQQESLVLSPAAAPVWRRALQHGDSQVREWAIDALSRIGDVADFELLEALLGDVARSVRVRARDALVRADRERAAVAMRAMLASDEPELVVLAAEGSASLQDVAAVDAICERLLDPGLPEPTRGALAWPLARLGDARALTALVRVAVDAAAGIALRRLAAEGAAALATPADAAAMLAMADADDAYVSDLARAALESDR